MSGDQIPSGGLTLGFLARDVSFLTRVLRAQIQARNAGFYARHGIAAGEVVVLNLIALNPGVSQNDLAAAVVLKKSAVTKLVNQLEAAGLVERRKPAADLRFNALHLTAQGEARLAVVNAAVDAQRERLLGPLDPGEREQLFALLARLSAHLAEPEA